MHTIITHKIKPPLVMILKTLFSKPLTNNSNTKHFSNVNLTKKHSPPLYQVKIFLQTKTKIPFPKPLSNLPERHAKI
jgi:hypothetical protein